MGGEFQALVGSMLVFDLDDRISSRAAAQRSLAWWCCLHPLQALFSPHEHHSTPSRWQALRWQALFSPRQHHSPSRWQAPLSHHSGYHSGVQPSR